MASVALVVLDTLRKSSFDRHFEWLPGTRYESAWSPSGWTVPVHGSLFTGRYPSEVGTYAKAETLDTDRPVLAERLRTGGFETHAFSANAYVSPTFDFDRGFDHFESNWRGKRREADLFDWGRFISETQGEGPRRYVKGVWGCLREDVDTFASLKMGLHLKGRDLGVGALGGADDGVREALSFVRSTDFGEDAFCFLNLMEAHSPYIAPPEYRTVEPPESPGLAATVGEGPDDPDVIERAYEDCVAYLADVYGDIFTELTADFEYVITLGDHGESFGTDGVWSHNHGLGPALTHVPLVVYRGTEESGTRDETVSLLDVHRTICELTGVDPGDGRGRDLLADTDTRPLLTERYGLTHTHVENLASDGVPDDDIDRWDTDLSGVILPDGTYAWETLAGMDRTGSVSVTDARDAIAQLRESLDPAEVDRSARDLDDEVRGRLEDLGYA